VRLRPLGRTGGEHDRGVERWAPTRSQLPGFLVYVAAAVPYIVIGVIVNDFLLSPIVAFAYLLLVVWLIPAVMKRRRLR
jgi:hypothetical protein